MSGGGHGLDNYAELGGLITETSPVTIGSAFRLDSTFSVKEGVYEVAYNFENKGNVALHLDVYQVSKGVEHNNSTSYEQTRYRVDIDLEPGQSVRATGQYYLTDNGNILPLVVADRSMESMNFGMTLSVKARPDLTEPETKPSLEPDPTAKVTLQLPEGIQVSDDYVSDIAYGAPVVVPSASQITNTTGKTIGGWYVVGDGLEFVTENTLMPETGLTIAPYYAPAIGNELIFGSGAETGETIVDYFGNTEIVAPDEGTEGYEDYAAQYDRKRFSGKVLLVDGERGVKLTHNGTLETNDYFRIKTSATLLANHLYNHHYTFTNNGEGEISFALWQLRTGIDMTDEGAVSTTVTVPAGETVNVSIENIKYDEADTNALTLFVMNGEVTGFDVTVRMAYEDLGEDQSEPKYKLTIGGGSDVTFEDGKTTASISEGSAIPAASSASGRTIAGWCDENWNKITSFAMPAEDTTIYPYFEVMNGYKRLWLLNGRISGRPDPTGFIQGSVLDVNNFESLTVGRVGFGHENEAMKTVVSGSNGFAEEGMLFKYNGNVPAGEAWRCDNVINGGPDAFTLNIGSTYDYTLNFHNKGTTKVNFDIYIINSVQILDSCENNKMTIELEAGQCITIVANDVLYTKGVNNNNMLMRFIAKENMPNGFALGISISAKIPT